MFGFTEFQSILVFRINIDTFAALKAVLFHPSILL